MSPTLASSMLRYQFRALDLSMSTRVYILYDRSPNFLPVQFHADRHISAAPRGLVSPLFMHQTPTYHAYRDRGRLMDCSARRKQTRRKQKLL